MSGETGGGWAHAALERLDSRLAAEDRRPPPAPRPHPPECLPLHTVYVPADAYGAETVEEWGRIAHEAVRLGGGYRLLAERVGVAERRRDEIAELTEQAIRTHPIEDLRIDFEDGFGRRTDAVEDAAAARAAHEAARAAHPPRSLGVRVKSLEPETRARCVRTLDRFVRALCDGGGLPDRFVVTLPKVSSVDQVEAGAELLGELERAYRLPDRAIGMEVQVELPRLVARFLADDAFRECEAVAGGRVTGLHFGTYDYSAALGIHPHEQRLDHPAADAAKLAMQLAAADTGVRLSDGSTNRVPRTDDGFASWRHHAALVRHSLSLGIRQGWDMHPLHLPTRFAVVYDYYLAGREAAIRRLDDYLREQSDDVLDEPASARSLAGFLVDGVRQGAFAREEIERRIATTWSGLTELAAPPGAAPSREQLP